MNLHINSRFNLLLALLVIFLSPLTSQAQFTQGQITIGTWTGGGNYGAVANTNVFNNANQYALLQFNDGTTFLNSAAGKRLHFRIENQDAMVVAANRRVGIGVINPQEKLHINDNTYPALRLSGNGSTSQLAMATGNGFFAPGSTPGELIVRSLNDDVTLYAPSGDLRFLTQPANGANEKMIVKSDGKVGIGTSSPAYDLDVDGTVRASNSLRFGNTTNPEITSTSQGLVFDGSALFVGRQDLVKMNFFNQQVNIGADQDFVPGYLLTVDGKIIAEELKIQNSTNWPDYVFEADYDLKDLSEVEAYIASNKHLPDVPGAADLKDGVEIGEMQKTLLRKVEELTLYLIELDKTVATQQSEINSLRAENAALKATSNK